MPLFKGREEEGEEEEEEKMKKEGLTMERSEEWEEWFGGNAARWGPQRVEGKREGSQEKNAPVGDEIKTGGRSGRTGRRTIGTITAKQEQGPDRWFARFFAAAAAGSRFQADSCDPASGG